MTRVVDVASPAEMQDLGSDLAREARPGDVFALIGDLGAGKTELVKGLARGLGLAPDAVTSPSFTLIQIYSGGRLPLMHVDLYRLDHAKELDQIGLDDLYRQDAIIAVEWFDRFPAARPPDEWIEVKIAIASETSRRVTVERRRR